MKVEIMAPSEFQSSVVGNMNRRKGMMIESNNGLQYYTLVASVPLNNMFGYSTELRSTTQGKGEFSMEYLNHQPACILRYSRPTCCSLR
jgi:elongation factor G